MTSYSNFLCFIVKLSVDFEGQNGTNPEHSVADGLPLIRMYDFIREKIYGSSGNLRYQNIVADFTRVLNLQMN